MDVKSKINFINSVAGGQKIPCPKCNALNEADAKFCITCGSPIGQADTAAKEEAALAEEVICKECGKANKSGSKFCVSCGKPLGQNIEPTLPPKEDTAAQPAEKSPFVPLKKVDAKPLPSSVAPVPKVEEAVEEPSIFAEGLPAWDIVPPQVMVRRKRR